MSFSQTNPSISTTNPPASSSPSTSTYLPKVNLSQSAHGLGSSASSNIDNVVEGDLGFYDNFVDKICGAPEWSEEKERILLDPYHYISRTPGKQIRSQLIQAFSAFPGLGMDVDAGQTSGNDSNDDEKRKGKERRENLERVKKVVEMLHNGSLMADDIEDDSDLRRGIPVTHKIFGIPQTLNSANYIYFLAFKEMSKLRLDPKWMGNRFAASAAADMEENEDDQEKGKGKGWAGGGMGMSLQNVITEELLNLHRGQGMDLYWRDSLVCPTEREYVEMVCNKTGGLLRIAAKLMVATSEWKDEGERPDYLPLVNLLGILYQIRDDYMNLADSDPTVLGTYAANKGYCEDLSEGKFSFPIVHAVRMRKEDRRLLNILRHRPTSPSIKSHAVSYMRDVTHSFDYTLSVLEKLDLQAREEVKRLGGNPAVIKILDLLRVRRPGDSNNTESSEGGGPGGITEGLVSAGGITTTDHQGRVSPEMKRREIEGGGEDWEDMLRRERAEWRANYGEVHQSLLRGNGTEGVVGNNGAGLQGLGGVREVGPMRSARPL